MSFTTASFSYKKTMSSSDINKNYHHIGSGNMMPQGASNLAPTTGVYDLGSNEYRWNKLFVDNIKKTGELTFAWNRIATVDLTATASSIVISGLNGDSRTEYLIYYYGILETESTWGIALDFNAGVFTYGIQRMWGIDAVRDAERVSAASNFLMMNIGFGDISIAQATVLVYGQTGRQRPILGTAMATQAGTTGVHQIEKAGALLSDITTTITSMVFTPLGTKPFDDYFYPGTFIDVFARR